MTSSEPLTLDDGAKEQELLVRHEPAALGLVVRKNATTLLTSRHVTRHVVDVVSRTNDVRERFSKDLPNVAPEKLEDLDDDGVIVVGAEVRPGDILVGRVSEYEAKNRPPNGDCGAAPELVRKDISLRCPPHTKGVVTDVGQIDDRVVVELTDERPLRAGDLLELGGTQAVVASIVDRQPAQIVWAGENLGRTPVRKLACAEDRIEARSIGPYSIVTQQPLAGRASFGGQRVDEAQMYALEARGAWHLLHEMLTVKSDDVNSRIRFYENIIKGAPRCEAGVPETTHVLLRELEALGFDISTRDGAFSESTPSTETKKPSAPKDIFDFFESPRADPPIESVGIALSSSTSIRARSSGEVKKPETINYRTFHPEREGLFCDVIFGPVRDYRCGCGKYQGLKQRGVICERCGVEVTASKVRRERFGHLELPTPLLHPWALPLVASLLQRPEEEIEHIVYGHLTLDLEEPKDWREAGVWALREAVSAFTSADMFFETWPVLPPDLRPLVPLDGGKFATSDLNDLYRRLINRANRLRRLIELDAPPVIIRSEQGKLQEALDSVVQNGLRGLTITGPNQRPLRSVTDHLRAPDGHLTAGQRGKRVDYSGAAVVVPADLPERRLLVPRKMGLELFKPWIYERLEKTEAVTTLRAARTLVDSEDPIAIEALSAVVADHPLILFPLRDTSTPPTVVASFEFDLWAEPAIGMAPKAMKRFGLEEPGGAVQVHVPAGPEAIDEARRLELPEKAHAPFDDAYHHRLLRPVIVREADCGSTDRSIESCQARGAPCSACSGHPIGTSLGLIVADTLDADELSSDQAALLDRELPPEGWLWRAARAKDIGPILFEAAIAGETDELEDPMTRALLGRIGFESKHSAKEGAHQKPRRHSDD